MYLHKKRTAPRESLRRISGGLAFWRKFNYAAGMTNGDGRGVIARLGIRFVAPILLITESQSH
jgi:hypothetical protein